MASETNSKVSFKVSFKVTASDFAEYKKFQSGETTLPRWFHNDDAKASEIMNRYKELDAHYGAKAENEARARVVKALGSGDTKAAVKELMTHPVTRTEMSYEESRMMYG